MYLFRIFYSFLPLRNPIGFGACDFVVLGLAILLVLLVLAKAILLPYVKRIAPRTWVCMAALFCAAILLRVALLAQSPEPVPTGADDFSYLLSGDTLRHFRLANAEHPLHQFFEAVFILQQPAYASIFPPGQGMVLALGQLVFQSYWAGVLISSGVLCALCYWMLRAWVAPMWAFAGGVLAIFEFGPLCPWVNSYWGGYVSAIAGCLVFGALPRLVEKPNIRYGLLLGGGLGMQLLTRPFEFIFLFVAAGLYVLFSKPRLALLKRPALGTAAVVGAAALLIMAHNKAVTHSWTTMPYMLSQYEYGVPATFTFQRNAVPHRQQLTAEQELDYRAQTAIHGPGTDSFADYFKRLVYRFRYLRFFVLSPLYLALLADVPSMREWRYRWAAVTILLFAAGTNFYPYFFPQYVAALTCLFVLLCVRGLEMLTSSIRAYSWMLCAASFVFWFFTYATANSDLLALTNYQSWNYINRGDEQGRAAIQSQLAKMPEQQLVFVRYSPAHRFSEWIHNSAEIDGSQTVWANDLGEGENQQLLNYYPNRKAWLLEPDAHPPALTPYTRDSGEFLTVH